MFVRLSALAAFAILACACGAHGGATPDAARAAPTVTLTIGPLPVVLNEDHRMCAIYNVPAGDAFEVVRIHTSREGLIHHVSLYWDTSATATAPVSAAESTPHDCSHAIDGRYDTATLLFSSLAMDASEDLPGGVSLHMVPGQRLIVEAHTIGVADMTSQATATVELVGATPGMPIAHHATVMRLSNPTISVASGQQTSFFSSCDVPYDVQLFGLTMRANLATDVTIRAWAGIAGDVLFQASPSTEYTTPFVTFPQPRPIVSGEGLAWTCAYDNQGPTSIGFGYEDGDARCIAYGYAYPTASLDGTAIVCP